MPAAFGPKTNRSKPGSTPCCWKRLTIACRALIGEDPKRLAPSVFADQLAKADRIADVTYRKTGKTWFVISGHYRRDENESGSLIYYAKFMFTPDLGSVDEVPHP